MSKHAWTQRSDKQKRIERKQKQLHFLGEKVRNECHGIGTISIHAKLIYLVVRLVILSAKLGWAGYPKSLNLSLNLTSFIKVLPPFYKVDGDLPHFVIV
jgi:hypothetical protein